MPCRGWPLRVNRVDARACRRSASENPSPKLPVRFRPKAGRRYAATWMCWSSRAATAPGIDVNCDRVRFEFDPSNDPLKHRMSGVRIGRRSVRLDRAALLSEQSSTARRRRRAIRAQPTRRLQTRQGVVRSKSIAKAKTMITTVIAWTPPRGICHRRAGAPLQPPRVATALVRGSGSISVRSKTQA